MMKYIDDPKLLELRFSNGMLILPFFYGKIMAKLNDQTFSSSGIKKPSYSTIILNLIKGLKKIKLKKAKILCLTNSRWESNESGNWKNIQHGYYYDIFPKDTLLLEYSDSFYRWKTLETSEQMSTICEYINLISGLLSKVCARLSSPRKADLLLFNKYYPFISINEIHRANYIVKFHYFLWKQLLRYISPKVVLMHCGSYGDIQGVICKVAHEMGIKTIDTQHGQVYNHKVYTASETVRNSIEYMDYMPDFFYSFGKYWSECVDWNYQKIEVGNPHLNDYVKKYALLPFVDDFLVISQPSEKKQQYEFVKALARLFEDRKVKVRLHPYENIETEKKIYSDFHNIILTDSSENLYKAMCQSRYVIGWCSTCLSELLAFKRIPIIVNTSLAKTFPPDLGVWINTPEQIKILFEKEQMETDYSDYWYPDFKQSAELHLNSLLKK